MVPLNTEGASEILGLLNGRYIAAKGVTSQKQL